MLGSRHPQRDRKSVGRIKKRINHCETKQPFLFTAQIDKSQEQGMPGTCYSSFFCSLSYLVLPFLAEAQTYISNLFLTTNITPLHAGLQRSRL